MSPPNSDLVSTRGRARRRSGDLPLFRSNSPFRPISGGVVRGRHVRVCPGQTIRATRADIVRHAADAGFWRGTRGIFAGWNRVTRRICPVAADAAVEGPCGWQPAIVRYPGGSHARQPGVRGTPTDRRVEGHRVGAVAVYQAFWAGPPSSSARRRSPPAPRHRLSSAPATDTQWESRRGGCSAQPLPAGSAIHIDGVGILVGPLTAAVSLRRDVQRARRSERRSAAADHRDGSAFIAPAAIQYSAVGEPTAPIADRRRWGLGAAIGDPARQSEAGSRSANTLAAVARNGSRSSNMAAPL
jgi:hypothetical protein